MKRHVLALVGLVLVFGIAVWSTYDADLSYTQRFLAEHEVFETHRTATGDASFTVAGQHFLINRNVYDGIGYSVGEVAAFEQALLPCFGGYVLDSWASAFGETAAALGSLLMAKSE